mgnify:FL=1|jgi:hypothetical protein
MGKLNSRIIATVLLVVWCTMVCAGDWSPQHRSVVTNTSDTGKIIFFIIYVILGEVGKKLDMGYQCPVYCEVNHKHRIIEYDTQREQGTNEKTGKKLDGSDVIAGREQSESGI